MNQQLIRDLAITGGIYDCITDPYDKLNNGDPYSSVMPDLARFAELIVQECIDIISPYTVRMSRPGEEYLHPILEIKKRFGVEQ
jgi:hypothetical protein